MSNPAELYDAILKGNAKKAEEVTKAALAAEVDPTELVQKYMIPAMDEVGKRFECNEYFVPELLIAARAMKTSLALITPLLVQSGANPAGGSSSARCRATCTTSARTWWPRSWKAAASK